MTPFFHTVQRSRRLQEVAEAWAGTPFAHYGATKGRGASCHCLAHAILSEAGFISPDPMPRVRVTRARQHSGGLMLPWLRARGALFQEVEPEIACIKYGDLCVFNLGALSEHHIGVAVPISRIIHCLPKIGAHFTAWGDPSVAHCLVGIFRPLESP